VGGRDARHCGQQHHCHQSFEMNWRACRAKRSPQTPRGSPAKTIRLPMEGSYFDGPLVQPISHRLIAALIGSIASTDSTSANKRHTECLFARPNRFFDTYAWGIFVPRSIYRTNNGQRLSPAVQKGTVLARHQFGTPAWHAFGRQKSAINSYYLPGPPEMVKLAILRYPTSKSTFVAETIAIADNSFCNRAAIRADVCATVRGQSDEWFEDGTDPPK